VAWELCWYQWRVDLAGERPRVSQIGKGGEVDELDRSARQWNAVAERNGRLALGGAAPRPKRRAGWLRRR